MKVENTQISGIRFMFTIIFFLQSTALLTSFLAGVTKHESWIPAILGTVISILLVWLYRNLMVTFPGKNLIQMLEEVFGKFIGKIIGICYVWFFINVAGLNINDLSNFAKITVMTETPDLALQMLCILVIIFGVRGGIRVITRYASLFTFVEFFIVGLSVLLLVNQMDFGNLMPIFNLEPIKYVQATHIFTTIPCGELVVMLMINQHLKLSPKQFSKYWFWGMFWGMLTVLVVLFRDIIILGNTFHLFSLPGLVSLRLVNVGISLSRVEILFAVALIMLLFFKISLHCFICVSAIAQLINSKKFKNLTLIVGLLIVFYGFTIYPNPVIHSETARTTEPIIWSCFDILIPLLILIIAKIKLSRKTNKFYKSQVCIKDVKYTTNVNTIWHCRKNFSSDRRFTNSQKRKKGARL